MTRLLMALMLVLTSGCATHYYQVDNGRLSLYLQRPDVHDVAFACSLDGFEPHTAHFVGGRWVVSLPSGEPFRYYYLLDGKVFVPPCPMKERDDFGSQNCIFDPLM